MKHYNIVIIGGGLTGNYAAYLLAQTGLSVAVIEEHPVIGRPWFCTGIVGRTGFDQLGFHRRFIQQELHSATFYSPGGRELHVSRQEIQAYVLNRAEFDSSLAAMAARAGAEMQCSAKCREIEVREDRVRIVIDQAGKSQTMKAEVCLLSTGVNYALHNQLGLGRPSGFLDTAQTQVEGKGFNEVELYLGREISPSSFAWAVPVGSDCVRIGVTARANAALYLRRLLSVPRIRERVNGTDPQIVRRVIPIGPIKKSYMNRLCVLGDAAGQVKPTTGGGIHYGLLCSRIAAEVTGSAFECSEFGEGHFRTYEKRWKKKIGFELKVGMAARRLLSRCNDRQIDTLFDLGQEDRVYGLIKKYADFDWHRRLILALARTPILLKRMVSLY